MDVLESKILLCGEKMRGRVHQSLHKVGSCIITWGSGPPPH